MALLSFRIFFGVLLGASAVGKLLDNRGFAAVIETYEFGIPSALLLPLGLAVSLAELALAGLIYQGRHLHTAARVTLLVHAGYLALAVLTNLRGLQLENCGCFGVFLARPMTWYTVVEDLILVLLAAGFTYTSQRR